MRVKWQALRYLIVGVANTGFGLAVIFAAKGLVGMGDVAANATGYAAGLCLSFVLNAQWTFAYRGPWLGAALRYALVIATAYAANLLTVLAALHWTEANAYLCQALGVIPYTVVGYLGGRYFAFASDRCALKIESTPVLGGER